MEFDIEPNNEVTRKIKKFKYTKVELTEIYNKERWELRHKSRNIDWLFIGKKSINYLYKLLKISS